MTHSHSTPVIMMKINMLIGLSLMVLGSSLIYAQGKPNIILMMADDQGWGDTGYNGHKVLKTPHLDQMSKEGVTFNRFYAAAPVCSPSRGSVYTGRHPYRYGIKFAMSGMLEPNEITITSVLKKEGYRTGHFGKWHLGTLTPDKGAQSRWGEFAKRPKRFYCPPWRRDVDVCFVTESKVPTWDPMKVPEPFKKKKHTGRESGTKYGNEYFTGKGRVAVENLDGDDSRVIMDRVIPFIRESVESKKPFFSVVWFHTPHSPVVAGSQYKAMYKDQPETHQHYYGCITAMDEQVGRLRMELDKLGISDNTMIWYCSDNGPARQGSPRHVGSNGHRSGYKVSLRDGGLCVPGLLVWPKKIKQPQTIDVPACTSDYFPTILSTIGVAMPSDRSYDGINLWPVIEGAQKARQKMIGFMSRNSIAWTGDQYKLYSKNGKVFQLYDLLKDPAEKKDLSRDLPVVAKKMRQDFEEWKKGVMKDLAKVPK